MTYHVQFPGLGLALTINRVALSIGGFNIYWYGVIIAAGMMLALLYAFRNAVDFGIDSDRLVDVIAIGTVMAIVCARIYYVAMAPFKYNSIWEMIDIRLGGIAIYGAVIGVRVRRAGRQVAQDPAAAAVRPGLAGLPHRPGHRPLGQLRQPGGLRHEHYAALGHVQRGNGSLLEVGAGHTARRYDCRPHRSGASDVPV